MLDFSIIIPVYNAEKTLERCLNSINEQTFTNYEVILIDDGSSEQSLSICKRYEMQYPRYRVVHQSNSGPSAARNVGLDMSKGKYICFVDSDDFVETSYLQEIFDAIQKYEADVVFLGYNKVLENQKKEIFIPREVSSTKCQTLVELSEQDMFGYTWVKAFLRDVIRNVRFDLTLNLFEDEVFTCQVMPNCSKVGVVKKTIYNYNIGTGRSLIGRTHEDYCLMCDRVYKAWKKMLYKSNNMDTHRLMTKKANSFVNRCYYYAFERKIDIQTYFYYLRETSFFQEHTDNIRFDDAVKNCDYRKLRFEKMKYQAKVCISTLMQKMSVIEESRKEE